MSCLYVIKFASSTCQLRNLLSQVFVVILYLSLQRINETIAKIRTRDWSKNTQCKCRGFKPPLVTNRNNQTYDPPSRYKAGALDPLLQRIHKSPNDITYKSPNQLILTISVLSMT